MALSAGMPNSSGEHPAQAPGSPSRLSPRQTAPRRGPGPPFERGGPLAGGEGGGTDLIHAHSVEGLMAALWVRRQTHTPVLYHSHTLLGEELPTYYRPGPVRFLSK